MEKKILVFLAILIILVFGCSQDDGSGGGETTPFIGGSTGLLISFAEGAPPSEIYDGNNYPFDVDVKLKNDGEYTIPANRGYVKVSGILASDFGVPSTALNVLIDEDMVKTTKDSEGNVLQGSEFHAQVENLNYIGTLSGNTPFTIRADTCYEYGTTSNAKICVRENILDTKDEGVCKITEPKTVYNSGSPLQIVSFEESAVGTDKISFTFKIQKKGNGDVFKPKFYGGGTIPGAQCENDRTFKDKVYVIVDAGNDNLNNALSCGGLDDTGSGEDPDRFSFVTLYSGERTVRCSLDLQAAAISGDFEKVVKIDLRFDYQEDISTSLLIKHAVG